MDSKNITCSRYIKIVKKPDRNIEWRKLKDKARNRVNIGDAFFKWRDLKEERSMCTDAEVAHFLLDRFAAPPPAAGDIIVNIKCLLKLFQRCEQCWSESVNQVIRDKTYLSVVQRCHSCHHIRKWASNLSADRPTHSGNGEKTQNAQVAMKQPTGSLAMEVTEDQPPRLGGSGPSLVRRKKGNDETQGHKEVTESVLDIGTDSVQSQDDTDFTLQENTGGERKVKSLVVEKPETIVDQHASIEVTIDSLDAEDCESQTSQIDAEGKKKLGADGGYEGEDSVSEAEVDEEEEMEDEVEEVEGEEKEETEDKVEEEGQGEEIKREDKVEEEMEVEEIVGEVKEESEDELEEEMPGEEKEEVKGKETWAEEKEDTVDGESESDFDSEEEQTGLRESDSEAEVEVTASDSDVDPEEGRVTRDNGRGSGRGRVGGQGRGKEEKQLQKPAAETSVSMSADISVPASKQRKSKRPKDEMVLCPECGILYSTRLQEYRKCEHKYTVQCLDCGKYFVNMQGLELHRRRLHRQGHEFPCKFCLRPFSTRPNKLSHERAHIFTDDVPAYSCSECPMGFHDIILRNRHLKQHKSKRHICRTCCKEFDKGHLLTRHELSHSADKPFKCQVCQRAFAQFSQLKSHLRVHTGEKPFQCQLCDKSFNHNVSLKNHVRRYHSPDSGAHPDGGAGAVEQGEGRETDRGTGKEEGQARRKKRPQQVQLTFWTEWGETEGEEKKKRKRRHQCFDDDDEEGLGEAAKEEEEEEI